MYNKKRMVGIYKITNPKGKVYIGQSINLEERKSHYKNPLPYRVGPKLLNSLKKYGFENHSYHIIEYCTPLNLNSREIYWIKYYNCVEDGLNIEYGGNSGGKRNPQTIEKMRNSMKGKNSRKIKQYSVKGEYIKTWPSIVSAEREYGKGIKECLKGKTLTSQGYIWRYEDSSLPLSNLDVKYSTVKKTVYQYDLEDNFIKEWESITEIQEKLGFANSNISNCCLGKRQKTAYGYKWKYEKM